MLTAPKRGTSVSADAKRVEASGWARPLEVLASQPPQVRDGMRVHLGFAFNKSTIGEPLKQAVAILNADRKGLIARLNGWRSFWPGRNVTWAEVVDRLTNAFGETVDVSQSIEKREQKLQRLFWQKGLPTGAVIESISDAVDRGHVDKGRRGGFDLVRFVMQTVEGLTSLYTTDAAPAVNCVCAILDMLHPAEVQPPFSAIPDNL